MAGEQVVTVPQAPEEPGAVVAAVEAPLLGAVPREGDEVDAEDVRDCALTMGEFWGGSASVLSGTGTELGSALVPLPEGTAWAVHDRGGYRLAYPVESLSALPLVWPMTSGPGGPSQGGAGLTFLDAEGGILDERYMQ